MSGVAIISRPTVCVFNCVPLVSWHLCEILQLSALSCLIQNQESDPISPGLMRVVECVQKHTHTYIHMQLWRNRAMGHTLNPKGRQRGRKERPVVTKYTNGKPACQTNCLSAYETFKMNTHCNEICFHFAFICRSGFNQT